jgi:hypothetical protein
MSGQVSTGTVLRALFAGSLAVWSKAATIAKVRAVMAKDKRKGTGVVICLEPKVCQKFLGSMDSVAKRGSVARVLRSDVQRQCLGRRECTLRVSSFTKCPLVLFSSWCFPSY